MGKERFTDRPAMRTRAADLYRGGASIRSVAETLLCSFGLARNLLLEAKVELRTRGGGRRG